MLLNPLRTGLFDTLREMGADLESTDVRGRAASEIGDLTARYSALRGVDGARRSAPPR